jgi:hypothetical protein
MTMTDIAFHRPGGLVVALLLTFVSVSVLGCDTTSPPPSTAQVSASNRVDEFTYAFTSGQPTTNVDRYDWRTTKLVFTVQQEPHFTGGTARVRILDADHHEVYSHDLSQTGLFSTAPGKPGSWVVEVTLADAKGQFVFLVFPASAAAGTF